MVTETFTVAAAQATPAYHDKEGTLDVTCEWIERAGREGVDLLVFPETFFPGFPYWKGQVPRNQWVDQVVDLNENSLAVGDDAVEVIGEAAREADLHVVLGTNERDTRPGSETLYNSMFFFDRTGELVRRHRKLVPTTDERAIWGRGDPADLDVHETDLGTIGGLVCYENHMTLPKAALCAMGEEIHPAVWPGFWHQTTGSPGTKATTDSAESITNCDIYPAMREYAFETQTFMVACSPYIPDGDLEAYYDGEVVGNLATGGSMIVGPTGIVREGPVMGEEALVTVEFDRAERRAAKTYFDAMGHYTRWDAVQLRIDDSRYGPIVTDAEQGVDRVPRADLELSPAEAETIADDAGIDVDTVERVAERILADFGDD